MEEFILDIECPSLLWMIFLTNFVVPMVKSKE